MTDDDRRLMIEIKAQARIAYESRPKVTNASIMAAALGKDFPHRSADEIHQKIKSVWRVRGMLCFGE
ncbi:hypothetical protein [Phyllobacterium zundukense]|jgi:hypothetical protein|uniref:Uncharacterized protein n=1 Tax=Phyllobacterium zundukense TaxID=1867719 RepID=A0ACD4D028_9HYPH|nr:hypothetical protein [Phyllobacterium zundukense]UXN59164.1 hypothetical protein N8E88_09880 [Phyllobacterium zundukense]